jgi:hypothetical protein
VALGGRRPLLSLDLIDGADDVSCNDEQKARGVMSRGLLLVGSREWH